ncbi:hypothetical protein SDRG_03189 [Saprolegnia diclina VS20]|uniref:Uncharacterized protein n=1 Tax=Saprolegnia diclina (strain VS20) TaxID=1156394 RepID=T0S3V8_SAPDV|nr:hypothetical protein SDRG_03189 [Saprolegnia diclina VS20]EQC39763.1 hypothetical protein SDRG_03189 [Saprolegnia diclina VS20]|eukprot:XP_008607035.1 hypothetical protein SDRG_03189 [Saprolegnia diclina VS20]
MPCALAIETTYLHMPTSTRSPPASPKTSRRARLQSLDESPAMLLQAKQRKALEANPAFRQLMRPVRAAKWTLLP